MIIIDIFTVPVNIFKVIIKENTYKHNFSLHPPYHTKPLIEKDPDEFLAE